MAIRLLNTNAAAFNRTAEVQFGIAGNGVQNTLAAISGVYTGWQAGSPAQVGGDLVFSTKNENIVNALTERMRITKFGNIGIGTVNPLRNLHISGGSTEIISESNLVSAATIGRIWRTRANGTSYNIDAMNSDLSS